jgi:phosphoglycolate phosphatase
MVNLRIGTDSIEGIELAIFDKDGTLMELYHYWSQMVTMRAELIARKYNLDRTQEENLIFEMGINKPARMMRQGGPVGLKKREIVLGAAVDYLEGIGCDDAQATCFDAFAEVDRGSAPLLDQLVVPINGAQVLLKALHQGGCRIAIATTDRSERAKMAMEALGFGGLCNLIVGADNVSKPKPDPEAAEIIMERVGVARSRTVVVGDAITDVEMGVNAAVRASIGVLTGFAGREDFLRITPYVAESVAEIHVIPGG